MSHTPSLRFVRSVQVSRAELRRRWREATSWVAPMERWSFLTLRTSFLSYAVGALTGWLIGGTAVASPRLAE